MPQTATARGAALPHLLAALALLLLLGVVMADTHVPVALQPDRTPPGGAQVATFALG